MTPADLHPAIRECLAIHEAFRKLGFPPEKLFLGLNQKPKQFLYVQLKAEKEFVVIANPPAAAASKTKWTQASLTAAWKRAVRAYNTDGTPASFTDAQRQELFEASWIAHNIVDLISGIVLKGIKIPEPSRV